MAELQASRRACQVGGDRGLGSSARWSGQASFHAGDLSWPAALEDCAALGPLADIIFEVAPLDELLLVAGPQNEAGIGRHDGDGGHELLSRGCLLRWDVVELVALTAWHLRDFRHREGEKLALARDHRDQ